MPPQFPQRLAAIAVLTTLAASVAATSVAASLPVVTEAPLRAHLAFLADDMMEGRGTGQRGGALAVRYLETQAAAIGLLPANGAQYRQAINMLGQSTLPTSALRFDAGGKTLAPVLGTDVVFSNGNGQAATRFAAPIVFVGYGIVDDGEQWNDFAGSDVKGKLIIAMVNDPQPTAAEPNRFGGKSLTYPGRWT